MAEAVFPDIAREARSYYKDYKDFKDCVTNFTYSTSISFSKNRPFGDSFIESRCQFVYLCICFPSPFYVIF